MDSNTLKVLLDSHNQAYRSALDIVVDQFKSRITLMETTISDLTRSLEFTQAEVADLKGELKTLRKSDCEKQATIEDQKVRVEELVQRTNYQEDYSRRNNLRISGMKELLNGETWEQTARQVITLLQDKLQLPPINLERAHRVGPVGHSYPRTVIARFEKFGDREAVMRNARKLKGTGIYINEDLCPASQEIIKSQLPTLKQARSEGIIAFFKHTKLIIKEQTSRLSAATSDTPSGGIAGRVPPGTAEAASGAPAGAGDMACPAAGSRDMTQSSGDGTASGEASIGQGKVTTDAGAAGGTPQHQLRHKKDLRERKKK